MSIELAEAFPVGEFLADELSGRGWTQTEFAEILDRPTQFVSEIISGKKEITRESAAQIAAALGTSASSLLNLQDDYFLWRQRQDPVKQSGLRDVALRAKLNERAPMSVLRKRGFITDTSPEGQCAQLLQLLGKHSLDEPREVVLAARRSNPLETITPTQEAWLACVTLKATALEVARFEADAFRELAEALSRLVVKPSGLRDLPARFAETGVRLVYVEAFPSSKIDGAALPTEPAPTIGLSGRGLRLDKVLFTLLHEMAHILLGHLVEKRTLIDDGDDKTSAQEEAADKQAAEWILPGGLPRQIPARIGQGWVNTVATVRGVHPITVVGQLQNAKKLGWRTALVSNAPTATEYLRLW